MSDISSLSNQYDQLVATSEKINNSVIAFRKENLLRDAVNRKQYPKLAVSKEELETASKILLVFIVNVSHLLSDEPTTEGEFMPLTVRADFKKRLLDSNAFLDDALRRVEKHLKEKQPVTENDLQAMDILVSTLDTERNNLFRKLRTARG